MRIAGRRKNCLNRRISLMPLAQKSTNQTVIPLGCKSGEIPGPGCREAEEESPEPTGTSSRPGAGWSPFGSPKGLHTHCPQSRELDLPCQNTSPRPVPTSSPLPSFPSSAVQPAPAASGRWLWSTRSTHRLPVPAEKLVRKSPEFVLGEKPQRVAPCCSGRGSAPAAVGTQPLWHHSAEPGDNLWQKGCRSAPGSPTPASQLALVKESIAVR